MSILSAKKSKGRPKVDSEAVNVRMERAMLDAIDGWRVGEADGPGRPEAIRRLIEAGLKAPRAPKPVPATPPFVVGDRVRHSKLGLGTVTTGPVAVVGPDMTGPPWVKDAGWRVGVHWDDPKRTKIVDMASSSLQLADPASVADTADQRKD